MSPTILMALVPGLFVGAGATIGFKYIQNHHRHALEEEKTQALISATREQVTSLLAEAKVEANRILRDARRDEAERNERLTATEKQLLSRQTTLDHRLDELDRRSERIRHSESELDTLKDELRALRTRQQENLEKIAGLDRSSAREKLMKMTERDIKSDLVDLVAKLQTEAQAEAINNAKAILVTAMERLASDQTAERTVTSVTIASDELKGRIIGKEGRNIQAFERATGVDVIIDETPGAIILSSFDPIRRQIARVALEKLLADGRVHPARIEETVASATAEVEDLAREAGEKALKETGVVGIPPEIIKLLGQLKFRTSFSQNVLKHSVEMAHLAAMIAREIGADVRIAKTSALLHDIGKAVSHEVEGGHHHVGGALAEQYGMDPAIVHAITAHHDDVSATTPEALIVRIVDALSAARPGARGDTFENYARRMTELENLATSFPGIMKCYAVSAGRELRVIVKPERIDDLGAIKLARQIAAKVESTLRYPGVIKVNVIRETRVTEFAK